MEKCCLLTYKVYSNGSNVRVTAHERISLHVYSVMCKHDCMINFDGGTGKKSCVHVCVCVCVCVCVRGG